MVHSRHPQNVIARHSPPTDNCILDYITWQNMLDKNTESKKQVSEVNETREENV